MSFFDSLQPAIANTGFRMEGYYIWCGSPIKGDDERYYLFASRWPRETGFPQGYMHNSEIVLAVSDSLDRPFVFQRVIIGKRDQVYWDGEMAHNPQILKIGKEYVLFYIGSCDGNAENRAIGFATSNTLDGDWKRPDVPIQLPKNANNPAVLAHNDGSILMSFRDGNLKVSVARAERYDSPYTILNEDVFPGIRLEDPFLYQYGSCYQMLLEDNQGALTGHVRFGAHVTSEDGIHWKPQEPIIAYDHTLRWADGAQTHAIRRERPQLLFENGKILALFTAVLVGDETWNFVQRYKE